jgi:uncharacterized protein
VRPHHTALTLMLALFAFAPGSAAKGREGKVPKKGHLLYMTLSAGYHHASIDLSKQIVKEIGERSGAFDVTETEDVGAFTKENLQKYDAVMFYTTGELPMSDEEKDAFVNFLKSGHGFVGTHTATDTFFEWSTYNDIVGGYFNGHPWHQQVTIDVVDPSSKLVGFLGKSFQINDETYQVSDFKADTSHVLLKLDPKSVDLKKPGVHIRYYGWPVAWTRMYGKGRVYCNNFGHDVWVWKDPRFQEMLLNGIKWAMRELN